jgi:hypothetical protein
MQVVDAYLDKRLGKTKPKKGKVQKEPAA